MTQNKFETKIKPVLTYVGTIGATILSIAYVLIILVLIKGFKVEKLLQTTIFSLVSAGIGFVIMQFLKVQGISFAKNLEENEKILKQYYAMKIKGRKLHSISYYWTLSIIKDIIVKCITIAATSVGLVYIVIKGSNDWNLLLLAIVNLLMFFCFGLLALNKAYDFFNEEHMAFIKDKIKENTVC